MLFPWGWATFEVLQIVWIIYVIKVHILNEIICLFPNLTDSRPDQDTLHVRHLTRTTHTVLAPHTPSPHVPLSSDQ